jgi:low temperature requirement protein LtrA
VLAPAITVAARPVRLAGLAGTAHLLMITGIVGASVGYELVIDHPVGRPEAVWAVVILGGPALFVVGRSLFEYTVFNRVSWTRPAGLAALAAAWPAAAVLPPLGLSGLAVVILAGLATADTVRSHGRPPEAPSPPQ